MPKYVPLPDGSSVTVREGETPEQAYMRAMQMYPEAFARKEAPKAPTVAGQVGEFFKGILPGGIGALESAAVGASSLLPDQMEQGARESIASIAKAAKEPFGATTGYEDTVGRKFGEAAGSILPFFLTRGRGTAAGLGAGMGAGEARVRAEQEGATAEQRALATGLGAGVGLSEMFAPMRILGRVDEPIKQGVAATLKRIALAGGEEAAQEAASQAAQNLIAKGIYKPEQSIIEQVGESAAYGGAVGALAQGLLDMALGRRAKKAGVQSEVDAARAEEEAARAAEEARKAEPGYARQFVADYEARKEQFKANLKELKRPGNEASPDEWEIYKTKKEAQDALKEGLAADAKEYNRLRPLVQAELAKTAEEERKAKLTPFEYAFGEVPEPPAPKAEAEKPYWEMEPAAPKTEETAADYASKRIELAKDQMPDPTVADYAEYIMQDPAKAQELVNTKPRILGLNRKENEALLLGLGLQLKEIEKRRAAGEADVYAQREADLAAQMPQVEAKNPLARYFAGIEEQMSVPRSYVEPTFEYLDPMFEKALGGGEPMVKVPETLRPTRQAGVIREKLDAMFNQLASFEEEASAARRAGRMDYAEELALRANRVKEQLAAIAGGAPEGGLTANLQGVSPQEGNAVMGYGQTIARLRETQDKAINDLQTAVDQLAKNDAIGKEQLNLLKEAPEVGKGQARATQGVLAGRAEKARAEFITAVLEEVAAHRRAEGRGSIGQEQALRVASELYEQINELITRVQATPRRENLEEVTLLPAQMRAGKVTRGAVTGKVDKRSLAERPFGAYQAAVDTILDGLRTIRDRAIGERPQARRVQADLLRTQFPTTEAERIAQEKGERVGQETKDTGVVLLDSDTLNNIREALKNPNLSEGAKAALQKAYEEEVARLEQNRAGPELTRELRTHAEYSQNLLERALTNPDLTDDIRAPLERVLDRIKSGQVSRALLDSVDNIADRIISGRVYGAENVVRPAMPGRVSTVGKTKGQRALIGSDPYRRGRDQVPVYTGGMEQELQELQDIMRASEPTAREQIEAGQQQLGLMFEEPGKPARNIQNDLGYIRMTPENFAKSPRMKPVWEALAKARARQASQEGKKAAADKKAKAARDTLEKLKAKIENIKADTKFFQKDTSKWSDEELAKAFVERPAVGTTPEERALMDRMHAVAPQLAAAESRISGGRKLQELDELQRKSIADAHAAIFNANFTKSERAEIERIERHHREKVMPEYNKKIEEAKKLLAMGQRLDDVDNQLLEHMQSTNAGVKKAAQELDKEMAVYRRVLKSIQDIFKKANLTKEQRAVINQMEKVRAQNNRYRSAVEKALIRAKNDMSQALGELFDPNINLLQTQLNKAKDALAKEEAELDRVNVNLLNVLSQEEGANRAELATYELFKYEEKQGIIDDLRRQIETVQRELFVYQSERSIEFDGAYATAQAVLDDRVNKEREKLARLEEQLADMRGDNVGKNPAQYPFAYQMLEAQERQQRKIAEDAKKEADSLEKQAKEQQKEIYEELLAAERASVEADKAAAKVKLNNAQTRLEQVEKQLNRKTLSAATRNALQKERFKLVRTVEEQEAIIRGEPLDTGKQVVRDYATGTYKADPTLTKAEKEAKKQADDARQAEIDAAAVAKKEAELSEKEREIDDRLDKLYEEFAQLPGSTSADKLASIMADPDSNADDRDAATLKLGVLQQIRSAEAELQNLREPKPSRKPRAATGPSTSALTKAKPFRTGRIRDVGEAPEAAGLEDIYKPAFGQGRTVPDFEFSRGVPVQGQTVKSLQKELDKAVGGEGLTSRKVKLFDTVNDLFSDREYGSDYTSEDIPSDAKAFVDPKTGTAFMFAKNIGKNEGLGILLHEVGVHLGFRNLFNTAQYNALIKGVKGWLAKKDGSIESQVAQKAKERVEAAKTSKEQYDDELLAYTVEEAIKAGVKPSALRNGSPIQNWLSIVLDTLKRALAAFGINPKTMTAGDLVNMAYGAAQLEIRGTWHGSDAKFTAFDTKYAGAGEGAFDFRFVDENSLGAGPYTTPDKEYAEYYQHAVPFGKAANESGYGFRSYQDYRSMDSKYVDKSRYEPMSVVDYQNIYESNLLSKYLTSVSAGGELDPSKNSDAQFYVDRLVETFTTNVEQMRDSLASREKRKAKPESIENAKAELAIAEKQLKAAKTLDVNKIKGLTERPQKGYLYRSLDAIPREKVFSINSTIKIGDRPKIDALYKKYGQTLITTKEGDQIDINADGDEYNANGMFYKMRRDLGVEKTIKLLKDAGIEAIEQINDRKYIERAYIDQAPEILAIDLKPVGPAKGLLFSRAAKYASPAMEAAGKALDPFVSKNRSWWEGVKANSTGLAFETQVVDRFAGFERLAKYLPEHMGTQMMYYLRMYDQRMNFVAQAVAHGAPMIREVKRPDGKTERLIEAKEGPNIKNVVEILKDANPMVGNAEAVNRLFTAYMAGIRAKNKGFATLNFGEDVTQADLDKALSVVNNNRALKDIFDKARGEYNEYNRNLIKFLVETGALSKKVADRLVAENDYIPFYREQNGVAQLLIGSEAPIRIGSIKEQPYLHELVGGDQPILDFLTSSVQNTNMLVDMGMRNLATKNAVFELINLNAAKLVKGTPSGKDVVKFKIDGDDRYAVLATETVTIGNKKFDTGVPADILVKGMEGIPTQMPFIFRAMAMPAQLLRKGVTLSPLYMARQLFRDSLAAPIISGADFAPILGALKELRSATGKTLERRGITGGQQFKGTSEDLSMILREIASGKPGWMTALGKFEAAAMEADAATRRAQYNSYIEQGLSEMEATMMALESMNFNKRGASPSIHIANALIPFFNAQIQGLNVLYKAMAGKMPFNDKLKIRQKMLQRGGMMAVASMVYALMMQDDEAYENAEPDQKYGNWFLRFPGLDEPIRVPVPFEVGYIFKAIPEAIVNSMINEHGGEEAVKAFKQIILQTIPGGSSYGIPQALKPAIEVGLGKSFYTGRDILSAREKELLPEEQFRANTSEIAKAFGKLTGASPILVEQFVRGYTGTMGLAFLHALSLGVPTGESPEQAVKRLSEYPLIGGAFQPNDAGGIINSVYERMNDAQKVQRTYDKMVDEGRTAEADALLQRRGNDFFQAEIAKEFKANMNQLIAAERAVQASTLTGEEKRKQLDEIRKLKIAVAKEIRDVADKTTHLSFSL